MQIDFLLLDFNTGLACNC